MSTTQATPPETARTRMRRRVWGGVTALVAVGVVGFGVVMFGWMIDETRFDRPDAEFDELTASLDALPGTTVNGSQRWVEAPVFLRPYAWLSLRVEEAHFPALLDTACATAYPDGVMWSLQVRTDQASLVSLHADSTGDSRCPDFGFDARGVIDRLDAVAPALSLQAAVWDNGIFAISAVDEVSEIADLLPVVASTEDLSVAAGFGADAPVEVNSAHLSVSVEAGHGTAYVDLLDRLVDEYAVQDFWVGDAASMADGVARTQIIAPDAHHAAIEEAVRTSGLPFADHPVRFLEP